MARIECVKNNGKPYLRIVEGHYDSILHRQKIRVLKNLGPLDRFDDGKPNFLERFRNQFKNGEIEFDGIRNDTAPVGSYFYQLLQCGPQNFTDEAKNLGFIFLEKIYNELGIAEVLTNYRSKHNFTIDINGITKLLVISRILTPASKSTTFDLRKQFFKPIVKDDTPLQAVYDTLSVLDELSLKIQTRMNTRIAQSSIGRKVDLMYYDVTNYYFETMYSDEDTYELEDEPDPELSRIAGEPVYKPKLHQSGRLKGKPIVIKSGFRHKGVSKENRSEPIVQMGLFIDQQGIPVSFNLYSGNTNDNSTFRQIVPSHLNPVIKPEVFGKVVVVADSGMMSQGNQYILLNNGDGYIFAQGLKLGWNAKRTQESNLDGTPVSSFRDWILDDEGYTKRYSKSQCGDVNVVGDSNDVVFKSKSRIVQKIVKSSTEKDERGRYKKIITKEKQVVFWSKKFYDKEMRDHQKFTDYMYSIKASPAKLKDKQMKLRFIKKTQIDPKTGEPIKTIEMLDIDDAKLKKQEEVCGYFLIVTSEIDLSDEEIINRYHSLARIEESFRIIKSDLEGRPIHVWTESHIKAHFLTCFMALTIIRILQYKILKAEGTSINVLDGGGWKQGLTADKIKKALREYKVMADKNGICIPLGFNDDVKTIYNSFGVDCTMKAPTTNEINRIIKLVKGSHYI